MKQTRPIWTPWGWAVDRKRLTWLIVNWCFRNRKCFTCQFRSQYRRTHREVYPVLSRVQNIGYEMLKSLGAGDRIHLWLAKGESHAFFNKQPWKDLVIIEADRFLASLGFLTGEPTLKPAADGSRLTQETEIKNADPRPVSKKNQESPRDARRQKKNQN